MVEIHRQEHSHHFEAVDIVLVALVLRQLNILLLPHAAQKEFEISDVLHIVFDVLTVILIHVFDAGLTGIGELYTTMTGGPIDYSHSLKYS